MKIEFRLNAKDYQEANKAHLKHQKLNYYLMWLISCLGVILGIFYLVMSNITQGILFIFLGIILNPELNLIQQFIIKRAWNNQSIVLREVMEIEATPEYFWIKGATFETKLQWEVFTQFIETSNLFVIYEGKVLIRMIPKRAFADNEQVQQFRMILQSKIMGHNYSG